ncbi:Cof-type HAD-IIB family hydrolase [Peribacillus tepidiphilus]|uniref:Cof-type HAD-IIB family hydrolase n=1 Tax=Peribacillus tepidiphilus TaxID=2652445 RepID=UPI0012908C2A|nr:Cof-type HAD-IIB family hydrolase [Peribacillus tepidiphilus]
MSKIVFFDIDGTLLDHDKKLPQSTKNAIKKLQENGVYVAIATGRAPFMFEELREELDISSYVSFNGQYVVFEGQVIYKKPLLTSNIERLLSHSAEHQVPLVFLNEKSMKASVPFHKRIEEGMGSLKMSHPEHDYEFFNNNDIYQVLLFCNRDEEHLFLENYPEFRFIRWHENCLDVLPDGGSKAAGILKLIEKAGFKIDDVFAFGDGLNDIEMIKTVGTGVAMGNAVEELKKHADLVTTPVDEDGIYNGLKKLKLI